MGGSATRGRRRAALGLAAVAALGLAACRPTTWPRTAISVAAGTATPVGNSSAPVVSPDGTKLLFVSQAGNLGPTDTNGKADVYMRDLVTGHVTLVSTNAAGTDSGNGAAGDPAFSPDGTLVAYATGATNLGTPDPYTNASDIVVRDLQAGTVEVVSLTRSGEHTANGGSDRPVFSPDGTKVAFVSYATDLLGPPTTSRYDGMYVRDLVDDVTLPVSVDAAGTVVQAGEAVWLDDDRVAFETTHQTFGFPDANRYGTDIYVRDLPAATTSLFSAAADGSGTANGATWDLDLDAQRRRAVFTSSAGDLGALDTNGRSDVYLRDLLTGETTLVSHDLAGTDGGDLGSGGGRISADGSSVVFASRAGNLGGPGHALCRVVYSEDPPVVTEDPCADIYVRDLATDELTMVSERAAGGLGGNGRSYGPVISDDGTTVAFVTRANDLGPRDTVTCRWPGIPFGPPGPIGPCDDIYVRDVGGRQARLVSARFDGRDSGDAGTTSEPVLSPDGDRVFFESPAGDLVPGDTAGTADVFMAIRPFPPGLSRA